MEDRPWFKQYDREFRTRSTIHLLQCMVCWKRLPGNIPTAHAPFLKAPRLHTRDGCADRPPGCRAGRLGSEKGDRVGIFMPNTPQFVMAYFAILKAGGVVVATNPLYTAKEIEYQVNDAGMEIMFVMTNFYNLIKEVQPKTKLRKLIVTNLKEALPPVFALLFTLAKEKKGGFRVDVAAGDVMMQDLIHKYTPSQRPKLDLGPDDVALFQYSGGTTGISKGAIALHRNLVANALQIRSWMINATDGKETVLMAIPLFHVYGMVCGMLFGIRTGASLVMVPNPRDLPDVLEACKNIKPPSSPVCPRCTMPSTTTRMSWQANTI